MINNITGTAFTDAPYFDQKIIYANRIKSIEGTFSLKKDGDIIRATNDVFNYKFDSLGRLESILQTKTDVLKKFLTVFNIGPQDSSSAKFELPFGMPNKFNASIND